MSLLCNAFRSVGARPERAPQTRRRPHRRGEFTGRLKSSSMPSRKAASSMSLRVRSGPRSQTSFSGRPQQGQEPWTLEYRSFN